MVSRLLVILGLHVLLSIVSCGKERIVLCASIHLVVSHQMLVELVPVWFVFGVLLRQVLVVPLLLTREVGPFVVVGKVKNVKSLCYPMMSFHHLSSVEDGCSVTGFNNAVG